MGRNVSAMRLAVCVNPKAVDAYQKIVDNELMYGTSGAYLEH